MADQEKEIFKGKIQKIMDFGAFVTLEDGSVGLVHISEISDSYVKNVGDYLKVGQDVDVVILPAIESGNKKRLSIKQAGMILTPIQGDNEGIKSEKRERRQKGPQKTDFSVQPPMFDEQKREDTDDFGDKLARFMKISEERIVDAKHQKENKRGGGYVRR